MERAIAVKLREPCKAGLLEKAPATDTRKQRRIAIRSAKRIGSLLVEELERLKRLMEGLSYDLRVEWLPNQDEDLSGEVKGNTIYIYERDGAKAIETLRHEFLDHAISQVIHPYREVTNSLIAMVNQEAYGRKERLVRTLSRLLWVHYDE